MYKQTLVENERADTVRCEWKRKYEGRRTRSYLFSHMHAHSKSDLWILTSEPRNNVGATTDNGAAKLEI